MKIFLLPVLTLFAFISCSVTDSKDEEKNISTVLPDEPGNVKVRILSSSDFNHEIISNGTVSAARKADLQFDEQEIIRHIYVKNGSFVKKGQKIAALDQYMLEYNVRQAADDLARARLELQDILIGLGYSLKDSASIPAEVIKIAHVRSNYIRALSVHELARYNLRNSVLYAPFDGIVANLFSKEYNLPDASQPFCTIINHHQLETDFMVLENELPLLKIGDKVMLSPFSFDDKDIEGRISEINPVVDKNGMVKVKAVISGKGKEKLYTGMNVKIRIQRFIGNQLVIPKEAVVLRNNKQVVFTLKNGKASWNYVQTSLENSSGYIVTDGLNSGDSIIYEGNLNLAHDVSVKVLN